MVALQKKNILLKYYTQVVEKSEFIMFCHITLEFISARSDFFYQNQIRTIFIKNSFLINIFKNQPTLQLFMQGSTGIIAFSSLNNVEIFLKNFTTKMVGEDTELLPLGIYWVKRNRILSIHYLNNFFFNFASILAQDRTNKLIRHTYWLSIPFGIYMNIQNSLFKFLFIFFFTLFLIKNK